MPTRRVPSARTSFACVVLGSATLVAMLLAAAPAAAQGKLDARYVASLSGIPIGQGAWVIDITEDRYTAAASGRTAGLARLFSSGEGTSASRGGVRNGALQPSTYASNVTAGNRSEDLRIVLRQGAVRTVSVEPASPPQPDRLPLTDAHRRGVLDPMTAALLRVPGNGHPVGPDACNRRLAIFDGRMRFDLMLGFKRLEGVRAQRGYEGPVAVCAVTFVPIAGYVPDRPALTYLQRQRDMEIWLAPIAGTRVVVPYKVVIPTPYGVGVLEATQFLSVPDARRADRTSVETP